MAFLGVERRPGEVRKERVKVGEYADGTPVLLPVATIAGRKDGPTVYIQGAVHGDEVTGVAVAQRLIQELSPDELSGLVVVVPISNLPAYLSRSRTWALEERTGADVKRLWPGFDHGLLSERISHALFREFVCESELTLDLHAALDGCDIAPFAYLQPPDAEGTYELRKKVVASVGTPYIYRVDQATDDERRLLPLSIRPAGPSYMPPTGGRALVTVEMGESRRVSEEFVPIGVDAVRRVLQALGVLQGTPGALPYSQRSFSGIQPMHIERGGTLALTAKLGDTVQKGQTLGRVLDVFGDPVEELKSPIDGFVLRIMKLGYASSGAEAYWIAA